MAKFAVHLHGTGCWFGIEEKVGKKWKQSPPMPMGFYTVRFVDAPSKEEAVTRVIEMVHAEVQSRYRDGYPRRIEVEEVWEDEDGFAKYAPGVGFSWYPEEQGGDEGH